MTGERNSVLVGNICCFLAYFIFGFNIVFCKNIANCGLVSPIALFCMRSRQNRRTGKLKKGQPFGCPFCFERKTGLGPATSQAMFCLYVTPGCRGSHPSGVRLRSRQNRRTGKLKKDNLSAVLSALSGKRGSDPRPQPWQGCALPTELFPHSGLQIYNEI